MGKKEKKSELKVGDIIYILGTVYSDYYSTLYKGEVLKVEERGIDYEDENGELGTYYKTIYLIECGCKERCKFYIDEDFEYYSSLSNPSKDYDDAELWHKDSKVYTDLDIAIQALKKCITAHHEDKISSAENTIEISKARLKRLDGDINSLYNRLKD